MIPISSWTSTKKLCDTSLSCWIQHVLYLRSYVALLHSACGLHLALIVGKGRFDYAVKVTVDCTLQALPASVTKSDAANQFFFCDGIVSSRKQPTIAAFP